MRARFCFVMGAVIFGWVVKSPDNVSAQHAEDVIESFAVDGNGHFLTVPVNIGGNEYKFALDTGATVTVVDTSLKRHLKPRSEMSMLPDEPNAELYECPDMTVGRSRLKAGRRILCLDIGHFRRASRDELMGFLGMDFLWGKIMRVDFDAGSASFLKRSIQIEGQRVPFRLDETSCYCPVVVVALPAVGSAPFLLDTGCAGSKAGFLRKCVFDTLTWTKRMRLFGEAEEVAKVFGGQRKTRVGVVAWQELDGLKHTAQAYTEDNSDDDCNALGLGYLSRFNLTFDFPNRVLILEKGKRFDWTFPANSAGLDIVVEKETPGSVSYDPSTGVLRIKTGKSFNWLFPPMQGAMLPAEQTPVVRFVSENGPAWNAGGRAGDRIISINGTSARRFGFDQIGQILHSAENGLSLQVISIADAQIRDICVFKKIGGSNSANTD